MVQEKWAADGSGSIFLLGYIDSTFRCAAMADASVTSKQSSRLIDPKILCKACQTNYFNSAMAYS